MDLELAIKRLYGAWLLVQGHRILLFMMSHPRGRFHWFRCTIYTIATGGRGVILPLGHLVLVPNRSLTGEQCRWAVGPRKRLRFLEPNNNRVAIVWCRKPETKWQLEGSAGLMRLEPHSCNHYLSSIRSLHP